DYMIKEFIGTGKTVEEATAAAKAGLNAPALADINVDIISLPKKKVLGLFGGKDAQVKVWYEDGKKEKKPQQKKDAPKRAEKKADKKPQPKKEAVKKEAPKKSAPKVEAVSEEAEEIVKITEADVDINLAVDYLKKMISGLKIDDAEVKGAVVDGVLQMEINCEDYGIIIGRRGETLDALQYLTSLAVKKSSDKYVRVTIDVGNYREKRMETLRNLARKNANYVLRTGRRYTFEPMNPYERRIIHTTVQDIDGVESVSVGYGQDRKVMLQSTNGGRNNNYRRSSNSSNAPAKNTAPKSDRADLPKFGKIEVNKD
ncbi:MAG: KH domain-containing protein, partial [Eubacterium sp.]|nr:KH domain-containing protein [Eubacterium sp.]